MENKRREYRVIGFINENGKYTRCIWSDELTYNQALVYSEILRKHPNMIIRTKREPV